MWSNLLLWTRVSVNYLFGRPLIPSDFLERIVISNFRYNIMRNSVVLGLLKMSFWVPRKVSYHFRKGDKTFLGNGKTPNKFGNTEQIRFF